MKKVLKITGVILGVLIIAVIVIAVFFPGLPTYISVKKNCPHIDETIGTYTDHDVEIPEDFIQTKADGVILRGPADALNDSQFVPFRKEDELVVMVMESEVDSEFYTDYTDESLNYSPSDYRHFFKSLDVKMPETTYESMEFIRNLTSKDCLKLRGTDRKVFEEYADGKEIVAEIETIYYYERDGLSGFYCDFIGAGNEKYTHRKNLMLNDGNKEWLISVFGNDAETVAQIISSIEIAE